MCNFIDTKKVVKIGARRKDEIRECYFCKQDCIEPLKSCEGKVIKFNLIKGENNNE